MPALLERRQPSYVQEMEGKPTWKGLSEGFPVRTKSECGAFKPAG